MSQEETSVITVLQRIAAAPGMSRDALRQHLGIPQDVGVNQMKDGYQMRHGRVTLERFEFDRGESLLNWRVGGRCLPQNAITGLLALTTITQAPSAHSSESLTYFTRDTAWGKLSFGFSYDPFGKQPACLRSVVVNIAG
jgi:hypothetical protein